MRWAIFVAIYIILDIYAFQAVRTITRANWVYIIYFAVSVLVAGNLVYQWMQPAEGRVLSTARSYALGFFLSVFVAKVVIVLFMFGEDIFRFFVLLYNKFSGSEMEIVQNSRRKFISQIALGAAAIPFSSLLYGMFQGKYNYRVINQTLYFDDLPKAFDGYKIVQISDIHSGSLESKKEIEYAIDLLNEQEGDVVLFTGDLVNNLATEMHPWMDTFSRIKAKDGVYSVLGNHDYGDYVDWKTAEAKEKNLTFVKRIHKDLGWDLLLNENRKLEKDGQKIALVGVENWGIGGFKKAGDIDVATQGLGKEDFKVVMSHDPSYWQERLKSDPKNYQLTLSGHTHGMQFGIEIPGFKWSPIQYRYKNWAGAYEENGRYIYVNRGFGYLGYPGRVGIWPEITVITLRKK